MKKTKRTRNTKRTKKTKKPFKPFFAVMFVLFAIQFIAVVVLSIFLIRDSVALGNYRNLQNEQITKVIENCNNKILNGMNEKEDLTRKMVRKLADAMGSDTDKLELMYLRDLSMSYCRASEFVLQGIQGVNDRDLTQGDYLFGAGDTPRQIAPEVFKNIQW